MRERLLKKGSALVVPWLVRMAARAGGKYIDVKVSGDLRDTEPVEEYFRHCWKHCRPDMMRC